MDAFGASHQSGFGHGPASPTPFAWLARRHARPTGQPLAGQLLGFGPARRSPAQRWTL